MPRDGSGVYHTPAGVHENAVAGNTIASNPYNANVYDVETDLNTPRPIVAGGTGATSADAALTALGAEKNNQVVTNFDAQNWISGSFSAEPTAAGQPGGFTDHRWAGICYVKDAGTAVVEARDLTDGTDPGTLWVRKKYANAWGSWYKMEGTAASINETRAGVDIDKRVTPYNHKYAHTPGFSASLDAFEPVNTNQWTYVAGYSEQWDSESTFNGASFQPLIEGWYLIGATLSVPTFGGVTGCGLYVNDTSTPFVSVQEGGTLTTVQHVIAGLLHLAGSDYVQVKGITDHDLGSGTSGFNASTFWGFRIGPNF
jgi:hypothetical protein